MRIGIDVRALQGVSAPRGIGRYTRGLLQDLWQSAPEHEYVLFTRDGCDPPILPAFGRATVRSVEVSTQPVVPHLRYFRFPALRRRYHIRMRSLHRAALARAVREADVDVLHLLNLNERDFFADAGGACPTVTTLYDLIPLVMHDGYIDTWMDADRERYHLQNEGYAASVVVAAISDSARADALRLLSLAPEKVQVVINVARDASAPVQDDQNADAACRERYDVEPGLYFLYCSGSGLNKNVERILEGFVGYVSAQQRAGRTAALPLVIAGFQTDEMWMRLKARAFDAGLRPADLRLCGYVPDDDLRRLQAGTRALVSPTLYEGFGLPAAEAMAVGTPVIVSNTSSYPQVVGDAGLLIDPTDANAIANALSRLAEDDALCATLSARGRARAETLFKPGCQAAAYLALYAKAASR